MMTGGVRDGLAGRACELRLAGSGGQGLQLAARMLAEALMHDGRRVAQSQSYEPTSRGGLSRADLVVAAPGAEVDYPLATTVDAAVLLDQPAVEPTEPLLSSVAQVIFDPLRVSRAPAVGDVRAVPLTETARRLGNERAANLVGLGALVAVTGVCGMDRLRAAVAALSPPAYREVNLEALSAGAELGGAAPAPPQGG